jgi:hypothetical protein
MTPARRRTLTIAGAIFFALTPVVVALAIAIPTGAEFREQLPYFSGFLIVAMVMTACVFVYGGDVWQHRDEVVGMRWWLVLLFLVGGPWVAIPIYWWRVARADRDSSKSNRLGRKR